MSNGDTEGRWKIRLIGPRSLGLFWAGTPEQIPAALHENLDPEHRAAMKAVIGRTEGNIDEVAAWYVASSFRTFPVQFDVDPTHEPALRVRWTGAVETAKVLAMIGEER